MRRQGNDSCREKLGLPEVIRVQPGNKVAGRPVQPQVTGLGHAPVILSVVTERAELSRHDLGSLVGGAIIDHDDLPRWQCLCRDALQRLLQVISSIVGRNNHTDPRARQPRCADHGSPF